MVSKIASWDRRVCPLKLLLSEGLMRVQIIGVPRSDVFLFLVLRRLVPFLSAEIGPQPTSVQRVDCFSEVDDVLEVMSR